MVAGLGRVVGAWRGLDAGRVGKPEIVGRVGKSCAKEGKGERGRGASRCGEGVDGVVTGRIAEFSEGGEGMIGGRLSDDGEDCRRGRRYVEDLMGEGETGRIAGMQGRLGSGNGLRWGWKG